MSGFLAVSSLNTPDANRPARRRAARLRLWPCRRHRVHRFLFQLERPLSDARLSDARSRLEVPIGEFFRDRRQRGQRRMRLGQSVVNFARVSDHDAQSRRHAFRLGFEGRSRLGKCGVYYLGNGRVYDRALSNERTAQHEPSSQDGEGNKDKVPRCAGRVRPVTFQTRQFALPPPHASNVERTLIVPLPQSNCRAIHSRAASAATTGYSTAQAMHLNTLRRCASSRCTCLSCPRRADTVACRKFSWKIREPGRPGL